MVNAWESHIAYDSGTSAWGMNVFAEGARLLTGSEQLDIQTDASA